MKEYLKLCCQACINSYQGRWGEPKPIFKTEQFYTSGPVQYLIATS